ncbi:hypothetical protein RJ639_024929 [Escallonia herrerae]|uniref:MYB transcription factor n=1 Tax=Escallonia herrerae TaxID=1293975 RepID=A0AA88SQ06_9ASTE|nr:hypothetical protein RJ639_024929 [Escallonia herrerae]
MGAPKQKWTAEEESALKAGVAKHGAGKWSTILRDPEFSTILKLRSNVDLKDKWRNINVASSGLGSRQRVRLAPRRNQLVSQPKDNSVDLTAVDNDMDIEPLAVSGGTLQIAGFKTKIPRLDELIVEAITVLKEPRGSSRAAIAMYIEEKLVAPPNLERLLAENLKLLTDNGKLIKVKHQYRIAPSLPSFATKKDSSLLLLEGKPKVSTIVEMNGTKVLTKAQIDAELEKMRRMTAQEAAAAAAQAVAEAEAAISDAEVAAREAEDAERDAEVAQAFAEAAMKALKC